MVDEKVLKLLVTLPFLSIIIITLLDLINNPWGTIHGIYKFQLSFYNKIFQQSNQGEKQSRNIYFHVLKKLRQLCDEEFAEKELQVDSRGTRLEA